MWYKTAEQRELAKDYIREAFRYDEQSVGVIYGNIEFSDADLSTRRAPKPPEEGAKLLIGEAIVVAHEPTPGERFLLDLGVKDLEILRKVTQDAWMKGGYKPLPTDELDKVIALTGPDVLEKMLRYAHEKGNERVH